MNDNSSKHFFLIASLFVPVVFGIIIPWPELAPFPTWPCFIGLILLCLAFSPEKVRNQVFKPIHITAHFVGQINQFIIMSIMFYLIFLPIGLIRRLFSLDSLNLKFTNKDSYWRAPDESKINFDRPY